MSDTTILLRRITVNVSFGAGTMRLCALKPKSDWFSHMVSEIPKLLFGLQGWIINKMLRQSWDFKVAC